MQVPANPRWSLLLAFVGRSLASPAEVLVGVVPRQCWLELAAGFLWGGPSPMLDDALVRAVPHQSWFRAAACLGGVVSCHSWLRPPWVQYPAHPSFGMRLALKGCSLANPG